MVFRPIRKHKAETTDIAFRLTGGLKSAGLPEKALKNFYGVRGGADAIFHCLNEDERGETICRMIV